MSQFGLAFGLIVGAARRANAGVRSLVRRRLPLAPRRLGKRPSLGMRAEGVSDRPSLFMDASEMKDRVRQRLITKSYNVADFYHDTGIWQRIARHPMMEMVNLGMVILNAFWIGIDMDFNSADSLLEASPLFFVVENLFCLYFTFEWVVRLMSFRKKRDGLKDGWFVFDMCLVSMMVMETWVVTAFMAAVGTTSGRVLPNVSMMRMARLMRLSRMTRMVRLLRAVPELLILIKGMLAAGRSVFITLLLLLILLYLFALIFRQLASSTPIMQAAYFSSVPASMYTLLIHGTFMDNLGDTVFAIGRSSVTCGIIFWIFVLVSALTVMNMLIGVICEAVSAVAAAEKESLLVNFVKGKMEQLFRKVDQTGDGRIGRTEFLQMLENPEATKLLADVGLDVIGLVDQADAIFISETIGGDNERTLDLADLMELVLSLRGTCTATVKDVIDLRKFIRTVIAQTNDNLNRIEERLDQLEGPYDGAGEKKRKPKAELPSMPWATAELPGRGQPKQEERPSPPRNRAAAAAAAARVAHAATAAEGRLRELRAALASATAAGAELPAPLRARLEALAAAGGGAAA